MWVLFVVLLTFWLLALIASGFCGLIHSVVTLCKSAAQSVPVSPNESTRGPRAVY
jgi:hypothetical protein